MLLVAGFAISPTLIALMALTEEVVPPSRLTEGMSIIHTGMAAGIAPGAALAGVVIDDAGASASYWVPVVSGAIGMVGSLPGSVQDCGTGSGGGVSAHRIVFVASVPAARTATASVTGR